MTAKELFTYLTQDAGLDDATAQAIMKAADNEKVATRASALKQQSEYDAIATKATQLEQSYAQAKTYQDWYASNKTALEKLNADALRYRERYGELDDQGNGTKPAAAAAAGVSKEDVQKLVNDQIQQTYAPQWTNLLKGSGKLIEKHLRAGRKTEIDWDKIAEVAASKGGDLVAAYDEWDAPERTKADETAREAEIDRRVKERMKTMQTQTHFPAGADATPSTQSPLSRPRVGESAGYDRSKVEAALNGLYTN